MLKKSVIVLIVIATIYTSCQKDQIEPVLFKNQTSQIEPSDTNSTENDPAYSYVDLTTDGTKGSSILNASCANDIPSEFFKAYLMYKYAYKHLHQPTSTSCSWTNYVLCAGAIANANYNYYPVTYDQIKLVQNRCNNSLSIDKLTNYADKYDHKVINYDLKPTSPTTNGRFKMIKYMLNHFNKYHTPFVALAIDPRSNRGHYLIVWSINWKRGGTGSTIYYTNSLIDPPARGQTFDDILQITSFTTFLDWMKDNPQADNYNCLFLWNK